MKYVIIVAVICVIALCAGLLPHGILSLQRGHTSDVRENIVGSVPLDGEKHIESSPLSDEEGEGEMDEHETDLPYKYFEHWYGPNGTWSAEQQQRGFDAIHKLPDMDKGVGGIKGAYGISSNAPWIQSGPFGMTQYAITESTDIYYSGRINSLAWSSTAGLLIGAAEGGVWKQLGIIFAPVSDALPSLAVGAVAYNPSDPNIVYLGTGDYNAYGTVGTGIYRSSDGGLHWQHMTLSVAPGYVSKILVAPWNTQLVLATTSSGIFRSTNDGSSWSMVKVGDVCDIAASQDGKFLLAGYRGKSILQSTDQGVNWTTVSKLPTSGIDRSAMAISPSNAKIAYVQMSSGATDSAVGVYKTTDGGTKWTNITPTSAALTGGKTNYLAQQWYNNAIAINPGNPNTVWLAGVFSLRSTNGGTSWKNFGATGAGPRLCHPDVHVLMYENSSTLVAGCDGGVFVSTDEGVTWNSSINRLLPITMFYNTDIERNEGRIVTGGAQDNGVSATTLDATSNWTFFIKGDGVDEKIRPLHPSTLYCVNNGNQNTWRSRSTNGGQSWTGINGTMNANGDLAQNWIGTFLEVCPLQTDWLFTNAGNYAYWSSDTGDNWKRMNASAFSGIVGHMSVNNSGGFVYCPVNDVNNVLYGFQNVGNSWTKKNISAGLPGKFVKRVHPSTLNDSWAYAVVTGVGDNKKLYKTTNWGATWTNITGNLPDIAVDDIVDEYYDTNVLYLGTDQGAFRSSDGGTSWARWNAGMPEAVRIMDMKYVFADAGNFIHVGTYGRSTFKRPTSGTDPKAKFSINQLDFGTLSAGVPKFDSVLVTNTGGGRLEVGVHGMNRYVQVNPDTAIISANDSVWFHIEVIPPDGGTQLDVTLQFTHNGGDVPITFPVRGFTGDSLKFRTFPPESLQVKKATKRKPLFASWRFSFAHPDTNGDRNGASSLLVEFTQPVLALNSYSPFHNAVNRDGKGKVWEMMDGSVFNGDVVDVAGMSKGTKSQSVKRWWWNAHISYWDDDMERTAEVELGGVQPPKQATDQSFLSEMPNAANMVEELFNTLPVTKRTPLVVGIIDPNEQTKRIACVAFTKPADLIVSLMPGKSGKMHTGPARFFSTDNSGNELIGLLRKLTPDMQSNKLFAELVALKLNILGSRLGIMPMGFGELQIADVASRYNGMTVNQLSDFADRYMTYGDSSNVISGALLDSMVEKLNNAFVGPIDTASFGARLAFTGVKPVSAVPWLYHNPGVASAHIGPSAIAAAEPVEFKLGQNYPNPFNPTTRISFSLDATAEVTLKVYDLLGRETATLLNGTRMDEGEREVTFDASNLSSGVYLYKLSAKYTDEDGLTGRTKEAIRKMVLLR